MSPEITDTLRMEMPLERCMAYSCIPLALKPDPDNRTRVLGTRKGALLMLNSWNIARASMNQFCPQILEDVQATIPRAFPLAELNIEENMLEDSTGLITPEGQAIARLAILLGHASSRLHALPALVDQVTKKASDNSLDSYEFVARMAMTVNSLQRGIGMKVIDAIFSKDVLFTLGCLEEHSLIAWEITRQTTDVRGQLAMIGRIPHIQQIPPLIAYASDNVHGITDQSQRIAPYVERVDRETFLERHGAAQASMSTSEDFHKWRRDVLVGAKLNGLAKGYYQELLQRAND